MVCESPSPTNTSRIGFGRPDGCPPSQIPSSRTIGNASTRSGVRGLDRRRKAPERVEPGAKPGLKSSDAQEAAQRDARAERGDPDARAEEDRDERHEAHRV